MSRSATMQFAWLTEQEARDILATMGKGGDTHGDRLVAQRVVEFHEKSRAERARQETESHDR